MLTIAHTPPAGCDALCVQVPGVHPPVDELHVGAPLCTCYMCVLTSLHAAWGVAMCRIVVYSARVCYMEKAT